VGSASSGFTDTTASNVGAYYYRVAALGGDGVTAGNGSAQAYAARSGTPPTTPTAASVTYPASYQVRLDWIDSASTESGYRIERSPAGTALWSVLVTGLAVNSTRYTDTTVLPGSSYDYRITAYGAAGVSGFVSVTGPPADTADADGDGVVNLIEFALGSEPTDSASVAIPTVQVAGLRLQLTFQRARSEVTYTVEASGDLVTWTAIATNPGLVGQSVTVTDTVDVSTSNPPRRFLRLRVSAP